MLAHSAHRHGSPLQGVVTVSDGTRGNSDSKEHVCTSHGTSGGQAQNSPGDWELEKLGSGMGSRANRAWSTGWEVAVPIWRSQMGGN